MLVDEIVSLEHTRHEVRVLLVFEADHECRGVVRGPDPKSVPRVRVNRVVLVALWKGL